MRGIGTIPIIPGFVRKEFLHDQKQGHGKFVPMYAFAFCAIPGRVPAFQIMLDNGSQWARVPIHAICTKPCGSMSLSDLVTWDVTAYEFEVSELDLLRGMSCRNNRNSQWTGRYRFTVDYFGGRWAEVPDQHKNHHIIELDSGQIAAWPNNRIQWLDDSWIKPLDGNPGYLSNSHVWSVGA